MAMIDDPADKSPKAEPGTTEFSLEDVASTATEESRPTGATMDAEELPEKYRGKSPAEIARMHQELEQRFGQQGNEVGQLRRTLDEFVLSKLNEGTDKKEPEPTLTDDDFFARPTEAINKALAMNPEIQQLKTLAAQQRHQASQAQLASKHPDFMEVLKSPDFNSWVQGSTIRQRMLKEADATYDLTIADELFTEYKNTRKKVSDDVVEQEKTARKAEVKKASTGTAKGAPAGRSSKKVFRRQDIVELMRTNPSRYEALAPEIRRAYAEGRVK